MPACSRTARCSTAPASPAGRASTSPTWCCCPMPSTAFLDPFTADPTLVLTCDILDPATMQAYSRDPRGIARRAEAYLKSSGIAEQAFFGPEPEFFIFDSVRYANEMGHTFFHIDSEEAHWNSGREYAGGNTGYRPGIKGGYFPVAPLDSLHDIRAEMCKTLEAGRHRGRSAPPRSRQRRPVRDRHQVQHADEEGRRTADDEVHHQERRPPQRQDRDVHAQAHRRRQRQRHARAPVARQGRHQPVHRRRLRRPVADGAVVHRRHLQARARDQRVRQLDDQLVQAPGAGLTKRR